MVNKPFIKFRKAANLAISHYISGTDLIKKTFK